MSIAIEKTVRELALEIPAATRVFEQLGIDYCCGGNQSLYERVARPTSLSMRCSMSLDLADTRANVPQENTRGDVNRLPT